MAVSHHVAQETFVAEIDGAPVLVSKGTVLPESHAAVKLDDGRGLLFQPLDSGEPVKKPSKGQA